MICRVVRRVAAVSSLSPFESIADWDRFSGPLVGARRMAVATDGDRRREAKDRHVGFEQRANPCANEKPPNQRSNR